MNGGLPFMEVLWYQSTVGGVVLCLYHDMKLVLAHMRVPWYIIVLRS